MYSRDAKCRDFYGFFFYKNSNLKHCIYCSVKPIKTSGERAFNNVLVNIFVLVPFYLHYDNNNNVKALYNVRG